MRKFMSLCLLALFVALMLPLFASACDGPFAERRASRQERRANSVLGFGVFAARTPATASAATSSTLYVEKTLTKQSATSAVGRLAAPCAACEAAKSAKH